MSRRREALLLGLAALVFVGGFAARPLVRAVDPDLAVQELFLAWASARAISDAPPAARAPGAPPPPPA